MGCFDLFLILREKRNRNTSTLRNTTLVLAECFLCRSRWCAFWFVDKMETVVRTGGEVPIKYAKLNFSLLNKFENSICERNKKTRSLCRIQLFLVFRELIYSPNLCTVETRSWTLKGEVGLDGGPQLKSRSFFVQCWVLMVMLWWLLTLFYWTRCLVVLVVALYQSLDRSERCWPLVGVSQLVALQFQGVQSTYGLLSAQLLHGSTVRLRISHLQHTIPRCSSSVGWILRVSSNIFRRHSIALPTVAHFLSELRLHWCTPSLYFVILPNLGGEWKTFLVASPEMLSVGCCFANCRRCQGAMGTFLRRRVEKLRMVRLKKIWFIVFFGRSGLSGSIAELGKIEKVLLFLLLLVDRQGRIILFPLLFFLVPEINIRINEFSTPIFVWKQHGNGETIMSSIQLYFNFKKHSPSISLWNKILLEGTSVIFYCKLPKKSLKK